RISNILERNNIEKLVRLQLQALENSMDGVAILTHRGEYVYVNEAQVKVFGFMGSDDIVGHNWKALYDEKEMQRLQTEILPEFEKQGKWLGEVTAKKKDGTTYQQEISLTKIEEQNKFITICRDVTERKKLEKEKEELEKKLYLTSRLASIAGLAAGVTVELNAPLEILRTKLQGLLDIVNKPQMEEKDKEAGKQHIDELESNIRNVVEIINELRAYSSVDLKHEAKIINIHKIIMSTVELVTKSYQQVGVKINLNLQATDHIISGDDSKFAQVIINFLDNAKESMIIKKQKLAAAATAAATAAAPITESIIDVTTINSDNNIHISITDFGIGIPEENIGKIFDSFFNTKDTYSPLAQGGTGLGLGLSKIVISELDGTIDVKSKVEEGTTFTLKIPLPRITEN
ncbi:MAG: PAS domain-containing sensor histidine kinase, partial [Oligoflexia bacterium]|nr:PAS domain-containing sensor histidine kinase [Oligoflexia bacterium]